MKNKNFTSKLNAMVSKTYLAFMFLFVLFAVQNVNAQTADCPLSSNNLVQVSLDNNCESIVTPEMIIEGENDNVVCNYKIYTIVDADGNEVGEAEVDGGGAETGNWVLDGGDAYQILTAEVGFDPDNNNVTWGKLYLEDKIAPTIDCATLQDVTVPCSEDFNDASGNDTYRTSDTDAYYEYGEENDILWAVESPTKTLPFHMNNWTIARIPFELDNIANQSEFLEYVKAVLNVTDAEGLEVFDNVDVYIRQDHAPNDNSAGYMEYPYKDTTHFYGNQMTDAYVNGDWYLQIYNHSGQTITVNDVKLNIKSKGFERIGNGIIVDDNCFTDLAYVKVLADVTTPNDDMCSDDYLQKREIKYVGIDWQGMKSNECTHTITWEKKGLADMEWPVNYDGLAGSEPPLSCSGVFMEADINGDFTETDPGVIWDTNGNHYPDPGEVDVPTIDGNPIYPESGYCMINVTYKDEVFDICPGSYKVLRKWLAYDMCEPSENGVNPTTHYQIIKVIDNTGMVFETNFFNNITVGADPFDCSADVDLPYPSIQTYGCSDGFDYEVVYCSTGDGVYESSNITYNSVKKIYTIHDLPVGETCVRYILTDDCGNVTKGTLTVIVEDDVAPIPICDEHTVVTVSSDCKARVNAETFDDGSFDNCTDVDFTVARMYGNSVGAFGDYVDFSGNDVGKDFQVVLKVTDRSTIASGRNSNTCMVWVKVENKFSPQLTCPVTITRDCGTDLEAINFSEPTVVYNCSKTLIPKDLYVNLNQCGVTDGVDYVVYKEWELIAGGITKTCRQYVTVENNNPFSSVNWPSNKLNLVGCSDADTDPSKTGEPTFNDDACSMVAFTFTDRKFNVVEDACYKILRDWTVIDWCNYNDENPKPYYPYTPGHPYHGMWTHTQVIMVNDNVAPNITSSCATKTVCGYNENCTGDVNIVADADDTCTPDNELVWSYRVEVKSTGTYYTSGNTNVFNRNNMQFDTYHIYWTVEDKCGNIDECDYDLIVKDCKKPTPLCYSEITTVVMPTTQPRMVVVKARDFDRGSDDNCTPGATCGECATELYFSFDSLGYEVQKTFTEDQVGLQELQMWVRDKAGNRDYCTVTLHVQDNVAGSNLVAGNLITEDDRELEHADVVIEDMVAHETLSTTSNANGSFQFTVEGNTNYQMNAEMDDNYLNGLTTLDIVLIQKHLLGVKKLNSPYKILAADANQDSRVTASDILALRKLILGSELKLENTKAWSFIDGATQFASQNNPWLENEDMHVINIESIVEDQLNNKFIGLKIGDVNNSVVLNSSDILTPRSIVSLVVDNVEYSAGDEVSVPVYVAGLDDVAGMQIAIRFNNDNLDIVKVEAGKMSITANNYTVRDGVLYMSWNSTRGNTYNEDEILFTIDFAAKKAGQLINQLDVANKISPEAYSNDLEVYGIELNYRNSEQGGFALYQNTPNPFSNETEITFDIPEAGMVTTTVYNVTGKVIAQVSKEYEKGKNSVKMSKDDLSNISGVLYYKVEFNGNTEVKKMILLTK